MNVSGLQLLCLTLLALLLFGGSTLLAYDTRSNDLCISGGYNKHFTRRIGHYTTQLFADGSGTCSVVVVDDNSKKRVFQLSASEPPDRSPELFIDSASGEPIAGRTTPILVIGSSDSAGYRYVLASLGTSSRILEEIRNGKGIEFRRLDRTGSLYLITCDGDLSAFLFKAFDGMSDYAGALPEVVLRLRDSILLNASNCFPARYDKEILSAQKELADRRTAGLQNAPSANKDSNATIAILQIVLNYLYSGREPEAWRTLHQMWTLGDEKRIQAAILNAYHTGILTETAGAVQCTNR